MTDANEYTTVEVYYYDDVELFNSFSQIDYVQLNSKFPNFNSYSQNGQVLLYEPSNVQNGIYYTNRSVNTNSADNTENVAITNTISNSNGILFFNRSVDQLVPSPGTVTVSRPTYQSDKYFGTNMVIQWEALTNNLRKITILYNNAPLTNIIKSLDYNNIDYSLFKNQEIYYYNNNTLKESYSQVNYVQLATTFPNYNSNSQNGHVHLYLQNGSQYGTYYTNRNIQTDSKNNITNLTITNTISNENGILFFYRSLDSNASVPGTKTVSQPTFLSGNYLKTKDMLIIWEVLSDEQLTRKLTILYNFVDNYNNKNINKPIKAIAVFNDEKIKGTVIFTENENGIVYIDISINGLHPNSLHGFHVHEAGDLSDGCTSACKHFNPHNKTHGGPGMIQRHVGDLGNLQADKDGNAKYIMEDNIISLHGENNIIGRCLIIHEDKDDCGKGGNDESLKTGNAGKRIACAVIGYSKDNFECK